ncbi:hypothetical protein [Embleya sp. NPDC005575]|uniref:hypothetical protein n=1 Tax=Embleya sp. NPDC005575 TaxID=3156892 RepID=UPI0033A22C96
MRRVGVAAAASSTAMVVADLFAYFVYRNWRTDLASRIDQPAEREALRATAQLAPRGNGATGVAVTVLLVTSVAMVVLFVWWAVLVSRNRKSWYGPSEGFGGSRSPARWTREARLTAIRPLPVAAAAVVVLGVTTMSRLLGIMGEPWDGPTDRQIELEMGFVHGRMMLALAHAAGALSVVVVVVVTTRRHERRLRAEAIREKTARSKRRPASTAGTSPSPPPVPGPHDGREETPQTS